MEFFFFLVETQAVADLAAFQFRNPIKIYDCQLKITHNSRIEF